MLLATVALAISNGSEVPPGQHPAVVMIFASGLCTDAPARSGQVPTQARPARSPRDPGVCAGPPADPSRWETE